MFIFIPEGVSRAKAPLWFTLVQNFSIVKKKCLVQIHVYRIWKPYAGVLYCIYPYAIYRSLKNSMQYWQNNLAVFLGSISVTIFCI